MENGAIIPWETNSEAKPLRMILFLGWPVFKSLEAPIYGSIVMSHLSSNTKIVLLESASFASSVIFLSAGSFVVRSRPEFFLDDVWNILNSTIVVSWSPLFSYHTSLDGYLLLHSN